MPNDNTRLPIAYPATATTIAKTAKTSSNTGFTTLRGLGFHNEGTFQLI